MARLVVVRGESPGTAYELPDWAVVLGRDEACDLPLDDPRASRQHASVRRQRESWWVRDLGSANGTFVDGERIGDWTHLSAGSEVRIGRTVLRLEDDAPAPAPPPPAQHDGPDPAFPGHEILERAGEGATGVVFRARQLRLDRIVAIKVLSPRLAGKPEVVERFVREARAAAALSHPHVVQVFDVEHREGVHWFSMEYMEGGTVEDLLLASPAGRLPWRESVRIIAAAAKGLAHLHANGLVHRDVKPANLLLDARREVKLGDLGTVVRADEADAERIGTPHFMSPEQAARQPVSRASDVYSLGSTLYRMLTGRTPFTGHGAREIVENVRAGAYPPVEEHCPGLPPEVAGLVREMMARDPASRPVDAEDLGRRLDETLLDVKQSARARRRARSLRSSLGGWAIGLGIAGAAAWAFTHQGDVRRLIFGPPDDAPAPPVAPPPRERTPSELAFAALDDIRSREKALDPPSAATAAAWRVIADDYARMAQVFPLDNEAVVRAHWRSREIRDELARAAGGGTLAAFAERWIARAMSDTPEAKPAPAIATAPVPEDEPPDVPGPAAPARPAKLTAASVRADRTTLFREAQALVERGAVQAALDRVLDWVRTNRVRANSERAGSDVHEAIAEGVRWMRRTTMEQSARLEADLDRDRALLRTHLPRTALFADGKPVRSPADALALLAALEPLLTTYLGRDLATARRDHLASIATAWPGGPTIPGADVVESVERSDANRVVVLRLAIESGRADAIDRALAAGASLPPDLVAAARRESAAVRSRATTTDPAAWRREWAGTVAECVAGGGAESEVFPRDATDTYFESWGGVPAGK